MKNPKISTHGSQRTIMNFTGLPQSVINEWMHRPTSANYEICNKMQQDLIKAQEKVVERWSKNKKIQAAISSYKPRKRSKNK